MAVAERGAGLAQITPDLLILLGLMGALVFAMTLLIERQQKRLALL